MPASQRLFLRENFSRTPILNGIYSVNYFCLGSQKCPVFEETLTVACNKKVRRFQCRSMIPKILLNWRQ